MYQITRRPVKKMQFKLGDEVVEFILQEQITVNHFAEIQGELAELQKDESPDAAQKIGNCIVRLMLLIFGDQAAKKILTYFEDDYVEMLEQIYPYLMDVVVPELKKRSKARAKKWTK